MPDQPTREPRNSVILHAKVVGPRGVAEVRVRNLSATGACIDNPGHLAVADEVAVSMGVLADLAATIVWVTPALAGLHFASGAIDLADARKPRARDDGSGGTAAKAGWMENMYHAYRRR